MIRSGRRGAVTNGEIQTKADTPWNDATRRAAVKTVSECRAFLEGKGFYQRIKRSLLEKSEMDQIVCYGIGNLSPWPTAPMWQLACALALRDALRNDRHLPLLFYDPCMTSSEAEIMMEEWNIQVITENERGKRSVGALTTLFFMPHCPLILYGNVLWANWDNLNRVILFGNSLPLYEERAIEKKKIPDTIRLLLPFVKEEQVVISKQDAEDANGNFEGAFNDCCFTWFSVGEDCVLPSRPSEDMTQDNDGEAI